MERKFKFGRLIGYGNSYLDSLFPCSKVFRLHAILHDAAGALRSHNGKGPGYCYMIGRGPNSCLLGHVTGLPFCLHVKIFLSSIFNSVDFWNSMNLIVLNIELTAKNIINDLGFSLMVLYKDFQFFHQRFFNLINRQHGTQVIYMELRGVVELDYDKLFAVFHDTKLMNAKVFAKGLKKCRLLTRVIGQNVKD